MKHYQFVYLLDPALSEDKAKEAHAALQAFVVEQEGMIGIAATPVKRNLAYPIQRKEFAYLAHFTFQMNPEHISALDEKVKQDNTILRFLLIEKKPERARVPFERTQEPSKEPKKKVHIEELEKKIEEIVK